MCLGVWWWPRRGSCRTPRSNETVSGFILYCMCSCAWHSRISWLNMKQENITLVRTRLTVRCLRINLLTNHRVLRPASTYLMLSLIMWHSKNNEIFIILLFVSSVYRLIFIIMISNIVNVEIYGKWWWKPKESLEKSMKTFKVKPVLVN
jgi:hypothetical protein